jgi:hypothetical protein
MAEERVSYLEPIDGEVVPEQTVPMVKSEGVAETIVAPEVVAEIKTETKTEAKSESETIYQRILSAVPSVPAVDDGVAADAQSVSLQVDADSKVTQLTDLAVTKGVIHAVKVARKLEDFYVLDRMHDDLANKLYESLKAKGLITE